MATSTSASSASVIAAASASIVASAFILSIDLVVIIASALLLAIHCLVWRMHFALIPILPLDIYCYCKNPMSKKQKTNNKKHSLFIRKF